jgi:hypothetical protein
MSAAHISELRRDLVADHDLALLAALSAAAGASLRCVVPGLLLPLLRVFAGGYSWLPMRDARLAVLRCVAAGSVTHVLLQHCCTKCCAWCVKHPRLHVAKDGHSTEHCPHVFVYLAACCQARSPPAGSSAPAAPPAAAAGALRVHRRLGGRQHSRRQAARAAAGQAGQVGPGRGQAQQELGGEDSACAQPARLALHSHTIVTGACNA